MWGCRGHLHILGAFYRMKIGLLLRKLRPKTWKMTLLGGLILGGRLLKGGGGLLGVLRYSDQC